MDDSRARQHQLERPIITDLPAYTHAIPLRDDGAFSTCAVPFATVAAADQTERGFNTFNVGARAAVAVDPILIVKNPTRALLFNDLPQDLPRFPGPVIQHASKVIQRNLSVSGPRN